LFYDRFIENKEEVKAVLADIPKGGVLLSPLAF
jgi:hypothetical protein